jgi:ectoine hydroxylase-related dioxygenase (phytanoyl-CoA dioxygenase family)
MYAAQQQFDQQGYVVVKQLFNADEVAYYREHYMKLRETGTYEGDFAGVNTNSSDPLKRYPRLIHMHRWDRLSLEWMIDPRINRVLTALAGREPLAVQTMLYFKPPGARGQALHQDNYYLRVKPGTCLAAWLALDPCDEENGCMLVVPGSHHWPILCTIEADTTQSFTDVTVPIPEGTPSLPVIMQPGDVLFFNGSLVHGSLPNHSRDRFRRALIGHYIEGNTAEVHQWYHPVVRMDGSLVEVGASEEGQRCGVWVEHDGTPVIEVSGFEARVGKGE